MADTSFTELLGAISDELAETGDTCLGDLADILRHRGYGPLMAMLAVIEMTPLGGIPTVPTLIAAMIFSMAAAMVFGRDKLWLPRALARREIPAERIRATLKTAKPWAERLDRVFRPRWRWLTSSKAARLAAAGVAALCLTVPPLELIPFASTIPMAVIALTGLALFFRDGLLMAVAFAGMAAAPIGILLVAT